MRWSALKIPAGRAKAMTSEIWSWSTKYRFSVSVEWDGENEEGEEVHEEYTLPEEKCDEFLFYEVKMDDLVQRIARHYGTNANRIAKDNKLYGNQLTEAGTILFIRNPATEEPYTYEEMTELEKTLLTDSFWEGTRSVW